MEIGKEFRRGGLTAGGISPFDRLVFGEVGFTDGEEEDEDELAEELADEEEEEEEEDDEEDVRFRLGDFSSGLMGDNDG